MKLLEIDIPKINCSREFAGIIEFEGTKKDVLANHIHGRPPLMLLIPLTEIPASLKQPRADRSYADRGIFVTLAAQRHTQ